VLLEELADATLNGHLRKHLAELGSVPLLVIDGPGMRKLPATAVGRSRGRQTQAG